MPIKVFRSTQLGAPAMNGTVGSKITALDAILVGGYNSVSVSSITRVSVTATVTTAAAHGFATGDVCAIAGAVETAYNGEFEVTVTSATVFTYVVAGAPSTPATGTITSKRAPAGFAKTFSGTNKAVYRANDAGSRRHYLRIVDDGTTAGGAREMRLWAYETMTDVDTGTGMYPTTGQFAAGYHSPVSTTLDSTARHWLVITDGKTLYCFWFMDTATSTDISTPGTVHASVVFGDAIEYKPGDIYLSILTASAASNVFANVCNGLFTAVNGISNAATSPTSATIIAARDFTGVAGGRSMGLLGTGIGTGYTGAAVSITYPHPLDNGFYMTPLLLTQSSPALIRGRLPGAFEPLHGQCFPNTQIIENVVGYAGRKFMMVYGRQSNVIGAIMLDITGPWD